MSGVTVTASVAACLANGLVGGVYLAFACAVSPALRRADDRTTVAVFRAVNERILNGWFLSAFFAAPLAAVGAWLAPAADPAPASALRGAAAVAAVAGFAITVAVNVPLNRSLAAAPVATAAQRAAARHRFERPWARANVVRTVASVAAVVASAASLAARA